MTKTPYTLERSDAEAAKLGLIVLQADETIEDEFRSYFAQADVSLLVSRIPSGAELTGDSIADMARDLPAAVALFPRGAAFDAIGYACTSGTTLIGADAVSALVRSSCRTKAVTNPLTASLAALTHLGIGRIGLVTPYSADIAASVGAAFEAAGVRVAGAAHFGETVEANVARISGQSIKDAAHSVAGQGAEAVFLSCTNLKTQDLIAPLEAELGVPVLSSNLALAWHMAKQAGAALRLSGRLRTLS